MDLSNVRKPYALSIIGFDSEKVIRPFLSQAATVKSIILLHSGHPRTMEARNKVFNILKDNIGVDAHSILLNDVFNFYEILMISESLRAALGNPRWINTTAGPGIGASALTLMASNYDIDIVAFDKETGETRMIPMARLKDVYKCRDKYSPYLRAIDSENLISLKDLAKKLSVSISTASRHVQIFKQLDLISISGSGRGNSPYMISLSDWGKRFLDASEIYLTSTGKD